MTKLTYILERESGTKGGHKVVNEIEIVAG